MKASLVALSLLLFAGDALAWGLQTHLFFAQHVLLAAPLLHPEIRRAALKLPRLVLAGACLPDLALAGSALRIPRFRHTHRWSSLRRLAPFSCDAERAVALGYASHLLSDVMARSRFDSKQDDRVMDVGRATHALCEWAMDDYLRGWVCAAPGELLASERGALAAIVAQRWRCEEALALRAIDWLSGADRLLRASRLPRVCRVALRLFDRRYAPRFEAYARETSAMLARIGPALDRLRPRGGRRTWSIR